MQKNRDKIHLSFPVPEAYIVRLEQLKNFTTPNYLLLLKCYI